MSWKAITKVSRLVNCEWFSLLDAWRHKVQAYLSRHLSHNHQAPVWSLVTVQWPIEIADESKDELEALLTWRARKNSDPSFGIKSTGEKKQDFFLNLAMFIFFVAARFLILLFETRVEMLLILKTHRLIHGNITSFKSRVFIFYLFSWSARDGCAIRSLHR